MAKTESQGEDERTTNTLTAASAALEMVQVDTGSVRGKVPSVFDSDPEPSEDSEAEENAEFTDDGERSKPEVINLLDDDVPKPDEVHAVSSQVVPQGGEPVSVFAENIEGDTPTALDDHDLSRGPEELDGDFVPTIDEAEEYAQGVVDPYALDIDPELDGDVTPMLFSLRALDERASKRRDSAREEAQAAGDKYERGPLTNSDGDVNYKNNWELSFQAEVKASSKARRQEWKKRRLK